LVYCRDLIAAGVIVGNQLEVHDALPVWPSVWQMHIIAATVRRLSSRLHSAGRENECAT
jgi:hypothetical protein